MVYHVLLGFFILFSPLSSQETSNSTHFVATRNWQPIKEGQKVPQGLHYRINLETGYKEAKILEEESEKTSLLAIEEDDETGEKTKKSDVDSEMEAARKRLEEALKNIPADKFDDKTEEDWKEISHKFRSYKELKEDLKDLELEMKTEMEILNSLVTEIGKENLKSDEKLKILDDLEYLCHNLDNSQYLISLGGFEVLMPFLNDSDSEVAAKSLRVFGVILQNNNEAKMYADKTNIGNYLINILSKSVDSNLQATAIFTFGSLMRNNQKAIKGLSDQSPSETFKKGLTVLIEIISNQKTPLKVSLKALTLIGDLLGSDILDEDHENILKYIANIKLCDQLEQFFAIHRNTFISDVDIASNVVSSLNDLKTMCGGRGLSWSDSANFRHELLVTLNNFKSQLNSSDEDSKFLLEEIIDQLESLTKFLYDHLEISEDDLSAKYKINDEL